MPWDRLVFCMIVSFLACGMAKLALPCMLSLSLSHLCIAEARCSGTGPEYWADVPLGVQAGVLGIEQLDLIRTLFFSWK
jgi:hypothetical protein